MMDILFCIDKEVSIVYLFDISDVFFDFVFDLEGL